MKTVLRDTLPVNEVSPTAIDYEMLVSVDSRQVIIDMKSTGPIKIRALNKLLGSLHYAISQTLSNGSDSEEVLQ